MTGFDRVGLGLRRLRGPRSQAEVAKAAGIRQGRLSEYENGTHQPSLGTLDELLKALDASMLDLAWAVEAEAARAETRDALRGQFSPWRPRAERQPLDSAMPAEAELRRLIDERIAWVERAIADKLRETADSLELEKSLELERRLEEAGAEP
ncbi:MAG: helix-turn-helix transcriptional regulator [Acidobacteriota bacterium]